MKSISQDAQISEGVRYMYLHLDYTVPSVQCMMAVSCQSMKAIGTYMYIQRCGTVLECMHIEVTVIVLCVCVCVWITTLAMAWCNSKLELM